MTTSSDAEAETEAAAPDAASIPDDIDVALASRIIEELLSIERINLNRGASGAGSRESHRKMANDVADIIRRHLQQHYGIK